MVKRVPHQHVSIGAFVRACVCPRDFDRFIGPAILNQQPHEREGRRRPAWSDFERFLQSDDGFRPGLTDLAGLLR